MPSFLSYDGVRLAYTQLGEGPPLVCVAGGPGRAAGYLEDLGGLSRSRTLVLLDARATGRSEVPPDPASLRYDRLADDLEALRAHLGLSVLDLLGHSAGALVAQAFAAEHRVGRLVLVTPSDTLQGGTRADVGALRAARAGEPWYADAAEAVEAMADAPPAQQQALMRASRPFLYGRWDERTQAHALTGDRQSSRRAELGFAAGADEVDVPALLGRLGQVQSPVLVVGGECDAVTGVVSVHAVAASFLNASAVVLPGAGHFPWVDEPEAFYEAVAGFLA